MSSRSSLLLIFTILCPPLSAREQSFEARPVHPLEISADGSRLYALNAAHGRLAVFATGAAPVLVREIPVGLLPVSVRLRTPDEAWVVNELSDSISVVSLSRETVVATLHTGDEPGDVAFIGGQAYVTCSRDNRIDIFDTTTREKTGSITLEGLFPRSLAVSPDNRRLYVSFLFTSNGTTILPRDVAPPPEVPDWAPEDLPPPPQTGQIVPVDHPQIEYHVVDHDVAVIPVQNPDAIEYLGDLGTNIFNLSMLADGRLVVPNSEARNLIRFEPGLRGRFAQTRLALVDGQERNQLDLNPDPDALFPVMDSSAAATAMAQVQITLPDRNPNFLWLAAFGSDRLVKLRLSDLSVNRRVDLRSRDETAKRNGQTVRGPRGLAQHPVLPHLYVLNTLSHTLTTVNGQTGEIIAETALAPVPDLAPDLKLGRGLLFDARLSANGSVSCASCHLDLERDGMAWDLGDPNGEFFAVPGALLSVHRPDLFQDREMHPMKGPMMTQTLIGLAEQSKLHWRGDKPSIQSFNSTFPNLLAAELRSDEEMDLVAAYLQKLHHHPNPHLKLDRNLPDELHGGDPLAGIPVFTLFDNHCSACHALPSGSSNNIDLSSTVGSFQPLKDTPLRTTYQRHHLNPAPGARSLSGYGLGSDGSLHDLPIGHPYSLHLLDDISRPRAVREKEKRDLTAFILSFDSGTAPAIGHAVTFEARDIDHSEKRDRLAILEGQSSLGSFSEVAVVAQVRRAGRGHSYFFDPESNGYRTDPADPLSFTAGELLALLAPGEVMTFIGVPIHTALSHGIDRNLNGLADDREALPNPRVSIDGLLQWPRSGAFCFPEFSVDAVTWRPLTTPRSQDDHFHQQEPPASSRLGFFRLRPLR